jgi:hypothetical protein
VDDPPGKFTIPPMPIIMFAHQNMSCVLAAWINFSPLTITLPTGQATDRSFYDHGCMPVDLLVNPFFVDFSNLSHQQVCLTVSKMGAARVEVSSKNKRERDEGERERERECVCVCVCVLTEICQAREIGQDHVDSDSTEKDKPGE